MKTTKLRLALFIGLMLGATVMVSAAKSFENHRNEDAYNVLYGYKLELALLAEVDMIHEVTYDEPSANIVLEKSGLTDFESEYAEKRLSLYKSARAIHIEKYEVEQFKIELKLAKLSRNKLKIQQARLNLEKAKLNLFRDELHFIIDKEALRQDHLLKIKACQQKLATHRSEMQKVRLKTVKQWITYDDAGLKKSKEFIVDQKQVIKKDKLAIAKERELLKAEMLAADKLVK